MSEPIHLKPKSKRGHYKRRLMQHYARYIKEWEEQRYNTCIKDTSEVLIAVVPFEEPHGDSPDTMQPQEQVPGDSPVQPQEPGGYSPVQRQEPGGYSPETSLGASLHGNSSDSSQPPPYASPSHQDANMEHNLRRSTRNRGPPCAYTPSEVGHGVGSNSDDEIEAPDTMMYEQLMACSKPGFTEMYTARARPVQQPLFTYDPNEETIVSVYRINDLSDEELSVEIYNYAFGYLLAGCMVRLKDGFSMLVVSGKQNGIAKFRRLMLKCINWAALQKSQNTVDEESKKKNEVNKCVLLWEGSVAKASFKWFNEYKCKTEAEAHQVFMDAGIADYWELAVNHSAD
ncbi:hypothetical protein LguiA_012794 [Lonicera macranthoides]